MTPAQVALVQESWKQVAPISDAAAGLFYGKLFELDPSLTKLFKGDMTEQGRNGSMSLTHRRRAPGRPRHARAASCSWAPAPETRSS